MKQKSLTKCEGFLQHLGTSAGAWTPAELQIGLQGGQWLIPEIGLTWIRTPGIRKQAIILGSLAKAEAPRAYLEARWPYRLVYAQASHSVSHFSNFWPMLRKHLCRTASPHDRVGELCWKLTGLAKSFQLQISGPGIEVSLNTICRLR